LVILSVNISFTDTRSRSREVKNIAIRRRSEKTQNQSRTIQKGFTGS